MRKHPIIPLVVLCLFLYSCVKDSKNTKNLGQNNAVWSEAIYFKGFHPRTLEPLTDDRVKIYANTLKKYNIKYAYIFAGPFNNNGHLPEYAFSYEAVKTVKLLKLLYPELTVLPWIGGIQNKTVHLEDSLWVNNAIDDIQLLVSTLKVQGVHLDFEYLLNPRKTGRDEMPVADYGNSVNEFHRKLRIQAPSAFISSVVVATSPDTNPWKSKTSMDELKVLVKYIDQLSFLYFDTSIHDQDAFERNCQILVEDIQTLKNTQNIQYLIAVGTFVNKESLRKYRDLKIENVPNTLITIRNSIAQVNSSKKLIDGISIFCDWETEIKEWKQFKKYWSIHIY